MRTQYDLYKLANTAISLNKFEESARLASEAIALDPGYALGYGALARALGRLGKNDEAIEKAREAIGIDPEQEWFYRLMATAWQQKGNIEKAIRCAREAVALDPQNSSGHYLLGSILNSKGRTKTAIDSLNRALELEPDRADVHIELSAAYIKQREYGKAEIHCIEALELNPNDAAALHNLGMCRDHSKQPLLAAEAYKAAILLDPKDQDTRQNFLGSVERMAEPYNTQGTVFGIILGLVALSIYVACGSDLSSPIFIVTMIVLAVLASIAGKYNDKRRLRHLEEADPEMLEIYQQIQKHG